MATLIDSYFATPNTAGTGISSFISRAPYTVAVGQSFTNTNEIILDSAKFSLRKSGSPTGSMYAKLYAHSGVYGTSSVGTGTVLATSDAIDPSTLTTSFALITFSFSGANRILLSASTYYCIECYYDGGSSLNGLSIGLSTPTGHSGNAFDYQTYAAPNWRSSSSDDANFYVYGEPPVLPTMTTQAVSSIGALTATGNGTIVAEGADTPTKRGVVYSTSSHGDPGNVSPASSAYSGVVEETGSFGTGAFTESMTGLACRTTYYVRAYAYNTNGYKYGGEVSFTTIGFTDPANIYSSNNVYTTFPSTSGVLSVEVSKDAGVNWSAPLTKTFGGSDTLETYGAGSTELWGLSLTRASVADANFRIRLSQGSYSQVYKTFGFSTGTQQLTGLEIAIEGNYNSPTMSLDLLEVRIYYGTSILPVQAGSQAFATDGRKNGEGAGSGTGVLCFYDGTNWKACDTGATVAA